jgi:hypothetical protein
MHTQLRNAYDAELRESARLVVAGDLDAAFTHLERAHVLGQKNTTAHVRAHCAMLSIGWRRRDAGEMVGQLARIVGATLTTWIWVPEGNTCGANVSAFKAMEIAPDLKRLLEGDPRQ